MLKTCRARSAFGRRRRQNLLETLPRARFHIKIAKTEGQGLGHSRICAVEKSKRPVLDQGAPAGRRRFTGKFWLKKWPL